MKPPSWSHQHKVVTNITVTEIYLKTNLSCASNSIWIPLKIPRSWSFGPSNFLPMACAPTVYILPNFFLLDCHLQTVDLLIGQFLKWYCLHQSEASFDTVISIDFSASSFKLNFPTEIKILYQSLKILTSDPWTARSESVQDFQIFYWSWSSPRILNFARVGPGPNRSVRDEPILVRWSLVLTLAQNVFACLNRNINSVHSEFFWNLNQFFT